MAYIWEPAAVGTLRVGVGAINGEISDSVSVESYKNVTFGNVDNTAPLTAFINGGDGETVPAAGSYGLLPLFLQYLIGTTFDELTAKKTVSIGVIETE